MADNNQNREGGHKIKDATQAKPPFCDCVHEADCPLGKIGRLFEICRGTASGLTEQQCRDYRTYWEKSKDQPPKSLPTLKISDFPCIHRGEQIGTLDCGCSTPQIYQCSNPKTEFDTCIIRKEKPGRIEHNRCNCCEFIEQPGEKSA